MKKYLTLIDAHVHIHPIFDLNNFLDAAFKNFEFISSRISPGALYKGVLCLTESEGKNYFERLSLHSFKNFEFLKTNENNSLICNRKNYKQKKIVIIAGRQIVTSENLEVLGIGLKEKTSDGNNINDVIKFVLQNNGIPVIPWGVGKWLGKRGNILRKLIVEKTYPHLYLGDNGNRPFFIKKSNIFTAGNTNLKNLPGSDPLPFPDEEKRAGSFGIYFDSPISDMEPFKDLQNRIFNARSFNEYGKLETPFRFLSNQVRMQIVKHN